MNAVNHFIPFSNNSRVFCFENKFILHLKGKIQRIQYTTETLGCRGVKVGLTFAHIGMFETQTRLTNVFKQVVTGPLAIIQL